MSTVDARHECGADAGEIARMVRRARERSGLTQHELALRMGTTQSAVARWETGAHQLTLVTLNRIATALGTTFGVHFGAQGVPR